MLVVPAHQLRRDLLGSRLGFGFIHGLLDGPARGALTHFDRHAGLRRGQRRRLAQVRLLFHLDQELTYHITAKEFVIRGAAQRQAMRRFDHLHAVTQGPQHPRRAQHIARFTHGVQPGKTGRQMGRQDHLHANLGLTARIRKRLRPRLQQPAFDREQEKFIGQLFTGRLHVGDLAQLDGLAHRLTITSP